VAGLYRLRWGRSNVFGASRRVTNLMRIHDISLPISARLPVWPGDPPVVVSFHQHLERGDGCTLSHLSLSTHAGTHVDAPAHFLAGGTTVDTLALAALIGPALVVDVGPVSAITAAVLWDLAIPLQVERLLFRTRNSAKWAAGEERFGEDFVAITEDGAQWLVERKVRLVGVDYLSVAPFAAPEPTHRVLLAAGVLVVEGLNLHDVVPGDYELVCLPLRLEGTDGAPARAVLIERDCP